MRGLVETIYFTNTSGISEFLAVDMDDGSRVRMRGFLLRPKIGAKLCFENLAKDPDGCTIFQNTYLLLETREEASRVLCGADGISKKTAEKIIDACGINVPEYLKMPDLAKKLRSVPGLGPSKTAALTTFLKTQADHSCEFPYKSRVMGTSEPLKPLKAPYMARNPVKWGFFRLKGQEIPLKI